MPHPRFDRSRLSLRPLAERRHDLSIEALLTLDHPAQSDAASVALAERIVTAREQGAAVVLLIGAHVLRSGLQRFLIEWLRRGWVTHLGMNGGAAIHDFELALAGGTTESVPRYLSAGQFGLWHETGRLNDVARDAARLDLGFGEAIGRELLRGSYPHVELSVLAQACRLGVPATVHVGIGYDIVHQHPSCDGGAIGQASYTDFLVLAHAFERLQGGVLLNAGSAVMGPEVALKALAMVRNVAREQGQRIDRFTTAVFDLQELPRDVAVEPSRDDPRYYFRPYKTLLSRVVADGGESHYVRGLHRETLPRLHRALSERGQAVG